MRHDSERFLTMKDPAGHIDSPDADNINKLYSAIGYQHKNPQDYLNLGMALIKKGKYEVALCCLEEANYLIGEHLELTYPSAQPDSSTDYIIKALYRNPQYCLDLGMAFATVGNIEVALCYFKHANYLIGEYLDLLIETISILPHQQPAQGVLQPTYDLEALSISVSSSSSSAATVTESAEVSNPSSTSLRSAQGKKRKRDEDEAQLQLG